MKEIKTPYPVLPYPSPKGIQLESNDANLFLVHSNYVDFFSLKFDDELESITLKLMVNYENLHISNRYGQAPFHSE